MLLVDVDAFLIEGEGCVNSEFVVLSYNVGDVEGGIYMGVDGGDSMSVSVKVDNDGDELSMNNREGIDWTCGEEYMEAVVFWDCVGCKDVIDRSSVGSGDV